MLFLLIFSPCFSKNDKYQLAICAIFQDDAKYIPEWIDFHRIQGVQHFFLYNNLSSDDYTTYLLPYILSGIVDLIEWPHEQKNIIEWNDIQCQAYMDCINKNKDTCEWIAFLDTDEFLFSPKGKNLRKVLKKYKNYAGIGVNWMMYGTSGIEKIPTNTKMIDVLTMRAFKNHPMHLHIKSIVQPKFVINCTSPHFFYYSANHFTVDEHKKKVKGPFSKAPSHKYLRINHYWSRDKDFFFNVKCQRQKKWSNSCESAIIAEKEYNKKDDPIFRYVKY